MANEQGETTRLEAFSDGIFAVAITLLVLDIHVPELKELPPGGLGQALSVQWPTYLAYITSFVTILVMWINHDLMFEHIQKKDRGLVLLNGFLLMVITLIPFPTKLVAMYIQQPDAKVAAALFSANYFFLAVAFNLVWGYSIRNGRLLAQDHNRHKVKKITQQFRIGPLLYIFSFALSFINATASLGLIFALVVFFALPIKSNEEREGWNGE